MKKEKKEEQLRASSCLPLVLVVLDGWGEAEPGKHNAITEADTPIMDALMQEYPNTTLRASGEAVGLLEGQDGNSEAGHLNIGAGRVVEQDVSVITKSVEDGTFFKNPAFEQAVQHVNKHHSKLHVMGLLTDWHSAHAHPDHLKALLEFTRERKVKEVYLHLFTDGRDTPPYAGKGFANELQDFLKPNEKIVTVMGRLYLDRKKEWSRTERAYNALVAGEALHAKDLTSAIEEAYSRGETDEYVMPTILSKDGKKPGRIGSKDALVFYNLRSDRARQLTKPFVQKDFNKMNPGSFRRKKVLKDLIFVAMTDFGPDLGDILTAYPSPDVKRTLPMVLKDHRQYYVAETEKYAHMTYFFNGGYSDPVGGEKRILVNSPSVPNYDQTPAMSANEIADITIDTLDKDLADFIGLNFANADMIAHTGNMAKTVKALEILDTQIGRIVEKVQQKGGCIVITADHGNAECMYDAQKDHVNTEHSNNAVPCLVISESHKKDRLREGGVLGDVAPTLLEMLGIPRPKEMTGRSLFE